MNGGIRKATRYLTVSMIMFLALGAVEAPASATTHRVIAQEGGFSLDLYTQRSGVGAFMPGGDFAVDEDVFLVCSATYGGHPVVQCLVSFEVRNPLNESILKKTAVTDEDGFAMLSFRIPNLSSSNGTWFSSSIASISELIALDFMSFRTYLHDVAVTSITPARTWVYQGHSIDVYVTLSNWGFSESVTTTLFHNATDLKTIDSSVVGLLIGERRVIVYRWNTTGVACCGTYNLAALASTASDENDPSNNFLEEGCVEVRIMGDVDGSGDVNLVDIWLAAQSFGFYEEEPEYDFASDMNLDGIVNMVDMFTVAAHFGKDA